MLDDRRVSDLLPAHFMHCTGAWLLAHRVGERSAAGLREEVLGLAVARHEFLIANGDLLRNGNLWTAHAWSLLMLESELSTDLGPLLERALLSEERHHGALVRGGILHLCGVAGQGPQLWHEHPMLAGDLLMYSLADSAASEVLELALLFALRQSPRLALPADLFAQRSSRLATLAECLENSRLAAAATLACYLASGLAGRSPSALSGLREQARLALDETLSTLLA